METQYTIPAPGMIITENTSFLPGVYNFYECDGITISADNIAVDGNGAVFIGGRKKGKSEAGAVLNGPGFDRSLGYGGVAFSSAGTKHVTLKNISAKGWETGLELTGCSGWKIEKCDFSYNYHNPDQGWEEHADMGGMLLIGCTDCTIADNRANNVWEGLVLSHCHDNLIENNDFSHTSNLGLRLWASCRNRIVGNDLSWGLRKDPQEVHARDSACVLIETGSNSNSFIRNDMRFGGDGLFIRSLNGVLSRFNYFEENDTSFANNNAVECWDPDNVFVRNKANFSSYGFWLGGSDNASLVENEVKYNGNQFHNAPESFGNAGISVAGASGTNFRLVRNQVHHNRGPGIAIRNKPDYPCENWVIENNEIYENHDSREGCKAAGIYLKNCVNISFIDNDIHDNDAGDILEDGNCGDIYRIQRKDASKQLFPVIYTDAKTFVCGNEYKFSVQSSGQYPHICWRFSDGHVYEAPQVCRRFRSPGFHRVILNVTDGENAGSACSLLFVLPVGTDIGADGALSRWCNFSDQAARFYADAADSVTGAGSLVLETDTGRGAGIRFPDSKDLGMDAGKYTHLAFFARFVNEILEFQKDNRTPSVRLCRDESSYAEFVPTENLFNRIYASAMESRYTWSYFELDLYHSGDFTIHTTEGFDYSKINYIEFRVDTHRKTQASLMLDGIRFLKRDPPSTNLLGAGHQPRDPGMKKKVLVSSMQGGSDILAPLGRTPYLGDATKRWISSDGDGAETYEVDLGAIRKVDRVHICFHCAVYGTKASRGEGLPESAAIQLCSAGDWYEAARVPAESNLVIDFAKVFASKLRICLKGGRKPYSIYRVEAFNTEALPISTSNMEVETSSARKVDVRQIGVMLNHSLNENTSAVSNLIVGLYEYSDTPLNGKNLWEREYRADKLVYGTEMIFESHLHGLDPEKTYFLSMRQQNPAEGIFIGRHYRWAGDAVCENDGTYGYISDGAVLFKNAVFGKCWMKVYTDTGVYDLSSPQPTGGNRFGLKGQECIFRTFRLPHPVKNILYGGISDSCVYKTEAQEQLRFRLTQPLPARRLYLYYAQSGEARITLETGGGSREMDDCGGYFMATLDGETKDFCLNITGGIALKCIELE